MKHYLLAAAMLTMSLASCGTKETKDTEDREIPETKTLVLYYSLTGTTESVAQELQKALNADMESIEMETPYTGSYEEVVKQVGKEREAGELPKLLPLNADLAQYDTIFLGYPIWYGTYARPISALVAENDFQDKTVVTFCTFGSGGLEAAIQDLRKALPKAQVAETGFGIRNARVSSTAGELNRFLVENGYIEGSVEALPDYSEMRPVTEEEKQIFETAGVGSDYFIIFDAACGNYQFPLGTPVLAGKRGTPEGVDYIYQADNNGTPSTIYVTVGNAPDAKPEFTRVVR